jgi:CubicO group peptidase (beta-lactamase class C family)/peptidoglycan/LPS O-acetylase OafA/YrhL
MVDAGAPRRDRFLDLVRAVALVRVVLWHTFAAPVLTYVVAAVPTMFFVTGALLAGSIDRRGARTVVLDRLRRLLVPFWAYGVVAIGAMVGAAAVLGTPDTAMPVRALWWLFPLDDPAGSDWQQGWLVSSLWYVRVLLWLVLLAPLVRRIARRAPYAGLAGAAAVVVATDVFGAGRPAWLAGDLALYGGFLLLGMAWHDGRFAALTARRWTAFAAATAVVAAGWLWLRPAPGGIVNDAHPAHLLVGLAWLSAALAARGPLERWAARPAVGRVVDALSARSLTIYLWHGPAIVLAYHLSWRSEGVVPAALRPVVLLAVVAVLTGVGVVLFGWIEDRAARRPARLHPLAPALHPRRRRIALGASLTTVALVATAGVVAEPTETARRLPPAPSRQPDAPRYDNEPPPGTSGPDGYGPITNTAFLAVAAGPESDRPRLPLAATPPVNEVVADALRYQVEQWAARNGIKGVQISLVRPGLARYDDAVGLDLEGGPMTVDETFDSNSVTKLFTSTLVLRQIEAGRLTLDGPIPPIKAVPRFVTGAPITVRQLLTHRSGLVNYRDTPGYAAYKNRTLTPAKALELAASVPLAFDPGTKVQYSSSNYLVLGFLLEQVTKRPYDDLIDDLFAEAGLEHTTHRRPTIGEPNFSTSGIVTTTEDLARFGDALFRTRSLVPGPLFDTLATVDRATLMGPVWGYCPCRYDVDGSPILSAVGHSGATTLVTYSPTTDVLAVVNLTDSLWETQDRANDVNELMAQLRRTLTGVLP